MPVIARFMGPTWGPPGSCRSQVGPMNLAIWGRALMFPLFLFWTNSPVVGDLRHHDAHITSFWWCMYASSDLDDPDSVRSRLESPPSPGRSGSSRSLGGIHRLYQTGFLDSWLKITRNHYRHFCPLQLRNFVSYKRACLYHRCQNSILQGRDGRQFTYLNRFAMTKYKVRHDFH